MTSHLIKSTAATFESLELRCLMSVSALTSAAESSPADPSVAGSSQVTFQAEYAMLDGATRATRQTGYSGTGYVKFNNLSGQSIQWAAGTGVAGRFDLIIRYANGRDFDRPMELTVNGQKLATLWLRPTGGWSQWSTHTVSAELKAGTNTILLATIGKGGPYIDSLTLAPAVTTPQPPPTDPPAEPPSEPPLPPADPSVYQGPIIITHGGTYSGNWQSNDPNVPAVQVKTSEPVTIVGANIRSRGTLIQSYGYNADLTIINTRGYALNPDVRGQYPGRFLDMEQWANVRVQSSYMEGTSGIYLQDYSGDHSALQTVKVIGNSALNIDGRYSDGNGGYLSGPEDNYYVQFVQLNRAQGLVGAELAWNQVINQPYRSRVEDNISIYDSSGTAGSPLLVHDNYIQGAYAANPAADSSYSGGGIMLSDGGSAYVTAYGNQIIDTANYGIAISSGHDNVFYGNRIISDGRLADGTAVAAQNVGAYIWNMNREAGFANNSGRDNTVGYVNAGGRNDWWTPGATSWTGNIHLSGSITAATEAAEWTLWQAKLAAAVQA